MKVCDVYNNHRARYDVVEESEIMQCFGNSSRGWSVCHDESPEEFTDIYLLCPADSEEDSCYFGYNIDRFPYPEQTALEVSAVTRMLLFMLPRDSLDFQHVLMR
jgi:hypothetical protein